MSTPRIILASGDAAFEEKIRAAFGGALNGTLSRHADAEALSQAVHQGNPDVVAVGPDVPIDEALLLAARLDEQRPDVSVLLIAAPTPSVYKRALHAGVRDVISPNASDNDVRQTFNRAVEASKRLRGTVRPEAEGGQERRVIIILSPKGGSGKTTVATNLAIGLARSAPGEVALVDLDLQFGDVATAMRLVPEYTIADVAHGAKPVDSMSLKVLLTEHPTGVYSLCGPDNPADGEQVTAEHVTQTVNLLAEEFRYVVVDTSAGITEATLAAVEAATDLVLLCAFDVPSVRSLRKLVVALDQLGMTSQGRQFVLNRADSRVGLATQDVEATVGMTVDIAVPSSRSVPMSMNQGTPLLESDPRSAVSKQMLALTGRFLPQEATTGARLFKRGSR